jgi:hypothetical protein
MALTTGFQIPFGVQPTNALPVDTWSGPYTGGTTGAAVSAANAAILPGVRFQSMEVRLIVGGVSYKYWYYDGTGDANLVEMQTAAVAGGISGDYVQSIEGLTGVVGLSAGSNITITTIGSDIVISGVGTVGATGGETGAAGGIPADYVESLNGKTGAVVLGSNTQIIYNSSGDLTGSANLVYTGLTFGLTADMRIIGNLIVTGRIITSTGIQGDPDADIETIENMLMDGGEFS